MENKYREFLQMIIDKTEDEEEILKKIEDAYVDRKISTLRYHELLLHVKNAK